MQYGRDGEVVRLHLLDGRAVASGERCNCGGDGLLLVRLDVPGHRVIGQRQQKKALHTSARERLP
jgi:hypothetical protein